MAITTDAGALREWLNGDHHYGRGVALYTMYGDIAMLKDLFQQTRSPSLQIRQKLFGEIKRLYLQAVREPQPVPPVPGQLPPAHKPVKDHAPAGNFESDPEFIERKNEVMLLFKEQSHLQSHLDQLATEQERTPLCLRILELEAPIAKGWDELDYYREHRAFPQPKEKPKLTPIELIKRRNNLRTYITREKNEEKKLKLQEELQAIEEALHDESV